MTAVLPLAVQIDPARLLDHIASVDNNGLPRDVSRVFAIVFGLSSGRHRGDASAAVREGLANTGRVITAAAAVMVAVFASFAGSQSNRRHSPCPRSTRPPRFR